MEALRELFAQAGAAEYIGEAVTQEQHALQAAKCASDAGADEDTVLAALLHDVGHLLGCADASVAQMPGGIGTKDHERLGASFLVSLGFPPKVAELVRRHVDAKRFLCWKNPAYHGKLSEASRLTLVQQGGPMGDAEAAAFQEDPLKDTIVKMRSWDEAAKVEAPKFEVPALEAYAPMVARALERRSAALADKAFEHYKLTPEQLTAWREQGFLKLSDLLSEETKADVVRWAGEVQSLPETPGEHMCYFEPAPTEAGKEPGKEAEAGAVAEADRPLMLCRTENFVPYHAGLRTLLTEAGPILDVLEQLLNEPAVLFKEKFNYKLAGGGGFPAHQDAPAFNSFGQLNHLTLNVAVDAATPENGCLQVAPGHHTRGLFPQDPVHHGLSAEAEAGLRNWADVPLAPGDVLLFSSWLPHRSQGNRSAQARRALYVTYNGETDGAFRETYYEVKRREFPQKCEREEGVDYSKAGATFNIATPIVS